MSNKRIKVAFFAEILIKDFDGASRTMFQLIDRIPNDDFEYLFFCGTEPKEEFPYKIIKTPTISTVFNASYSASFPYTMKSELIKQLDEFNPDVIHIATPSFLGFFGIKYAKERNIPVLSIYHTHFISYMQYYFKIPALIRFFERQVATKYRQFYNRADMVYVPTQQMIHELEGHQVESSRLKLWQRGMNHKLFNPAKRDIKFLKNITGNDKPTIIYASRIVWEKNVKTLIETYQEAQKAGKDWNWVIAGDGLAQDAAMSKMPGAIFLGHVGHDELSKLYASCDVFVFPSISETYGNVVVEAMASGCIPVIARGGGSQSLVQDGVTGYLCEPNNPTDYINNIDKVLADSHAREKMQEEGYKYTAKLDWDILADTYFNDLKSLVKA